jgi:hypothetical protein
MVNSGHPLVGAWVEEGNPIDTTTVVYTISAKQGRFSVIGVDESDGVVLKISSVRWDGERLSFVSLFPLTHHKATHVLLMPIRGRTRHTTSYSDDDGDWTTNEVWKRRLS